MNIKFEDWEKLDLKIGTILSVEDHPNADKLYILKVDIGEERQLVAGIKESYSKEELINKKIIVIANLEPVKLRGIESQGMLLAVGEEEISLLTLDKDAHNGDKVR
jgi:methionyl-tRNA synthetase|tara:strand:- start:623 stop:940 length:318 start_codon:yes stop_codon:yes gene_type:complete